jgi:heptose-I-phosphate ethanolaminephosphotransferase
MSLDGRFREQWSQILELSLRRWRTHLLVAVWSCVLFSLAFYQAFATSANTQQLRWLALVLAFGFTWGLTLSLVLVSLPRRLAAGVAWVATLYVGVLVGVGCYHLLVYGEQVGIPSVVAALDTNANEAFEFFVSTSSAWNWVISASALLVTTGLGFAMVRSIRAGNAQRLTPMRASALCVASGALVVFTSYGVNNAVAFALNNPFLFTYITAREVIQSREAIRNFSPKAAVRLSVTLKPEALPGATHLLLLGESITPTHMSLYGYGRDTTPRMKASVEGFKQLVVRDACSSKHNTGLALIDILTSNIADDRSVWERPSLISMAREAGFNTYWISNQAAAGDTDNLASAWALAADEKIFVNLRGWKDGSSLDEKLLPKISAAVESRPGPKLLIVHMMGAHHHFARRYPAAFQKWNDDDPVPLAVPRRNHPDFPRAIYNQYDNAVAYTDHIVGEILNIAQRFKVASVTYISDHGQNLGEHSDRLYHSMPSGPRQGFEVPVVFWVSQKHMQQLKLSDSALTINLSSPYQTDRLLHSLVHLYGMTYPTQQLNESLLSSDFVTRSRSCDSMIR